MTSPAIAGIAVRNLWLRGHKVMLDRDLAALYGVETRRLNEQVRRNRERFPEAKAIIVAELEVAALQIAPNPASYIVSLTPGHLSDLRVLRWAVGTQARYIGMMGSRRKVTGIYQELQKEGVPAERLADVHAPIGLEIGADNPEEIAISIVAELIACRRNCSAALRHRGLRCEDGGSPPQQKTA